MSPERFRGRRDVDLSALGTRQAHATAQRIAANWRPVALYTSPLKRCLQTAAQIASACGLTATVLGELNDVDYGAWEWLTHDEVRAGWPALFQLWFSAPHLVRFPNGESLQEVVARSADVLRLVLARHVGETVVVVGHSTNNRALLLQVLDQPLSAYWRLGQDPGSLSEIVVQGDGMTVKRLNETYPVP